MNDHGPIATIIIPTLNEERSIGALIDEIFSTNPTLLVIVVDDNSSDHTGRVVAERAEQYPGRVTFFSRTSAEKRGITASVLDASHQVTTEYFVVMDGDLQHPPEAIPEMIDKLKQGADVVAGYRLPYEEKQAAHRVLATRVSTALAKAALLLHGVKVRDPMSGFFAANTKIFCENVSSSPERFEPEGYKVLFDFLKIVGTSVKIAEVPYNFRIRLGGKSKLSAKHGWLFLRSLLK